VGDSVAVRLAVPVAWPFSLMICVEPATPRWLSVRVRVPLSTPPCVGTKLMRRVQLAPGASEVEPPEAEQVEVGERVKPAVMAGVPVKVRGVLPLLMTVTVFGLSELVLPTAVDAKIKEGGVETSREVMRKWHCWRWAHSGPQ
jgi:hypothetical protein